jgi:hypothetical protein
MRRWLGRLRRLVGRLALVPAGRYRDRNRRRIKLMHALEHLQAEHAQLRAEYESLAARNRELLEELSLCRNAEHRWWRSHGDHC